MYPSRIIILVLMMSTLGYTKQTEHCEVKSKKIFDMFQITTRDTSTILEDVKMLTFRQNMQTENMNTLKTEQNAQINNIKSLVNELNTEIGHLKMEQRDLKQQIDVQALILMNISKLLLNVTEKLSTMASSVPEDCRHTDTSGPTRIFVPQPPYQPKPMMVYCDQTVSGGWVVFLRRIDDAEDFPNRVWQDYKRGFGHLTGSFWLGLQHLHELTARPATLRVELEDFEGKKKYAEYEQFSISGEEDGYKLNFGSYSGDAGNGLSYNKGVKFSTVDKDQDHRSDDRCTEIHQGAWWFNDCGTSQLTGHYHPTGRHNKRYQYLLWRDWKGNLYSYRKAEMMLRH